MDCNACKRDEALALLATDPSVGAVPAGAVAVAHATIAAMPSDEHPECAVCTAARAVLARAIAAVGR